MRDQLKKDLRLLFREDTDCAPAPVSFVPAATSPVHHPGGRARLRWTGAALVAASAAGIAAVALGGFSHLGPGTGTGESAQIVSGHGPPTGDGQAACAKEYSPSEVSKGGFAFSGTVRSIGPGRTNRAGVEMGLVAATFSVDHWFKGGAGQVVTVDILNPSPTNATNATEDRSPSFGIGTRLLVSGAHRWDEKTTNDLLAWTCGFTRYYDPTTADSWPPAMG